MKNKHHLYTEKPFKNINIKKKPTVPTAVPTAINNIEYV